MAADAIEILYFAWVREITGKDGETLPAPFPQSIGALRDLICARYPALQERADKLQIAINQDHAADNAVINRGDEIAIFPPVTGG